MKRYAAILMAIAFALALSCSFAFAEDQVRETDVETASDGNVMVLVGGTFKYVPKGDILARINEIRLEACQEGVQDPRNSSRKLTESDYVPIKWSSDLEWIAQTRAAEASLHRDHKRPNGRTCFQLYHNNIYSSGENLAWNSNADIFGGIDQWYEEKTFWVNQTEGKVTGHYTSIINPNYTYIGIGGFKPDQGYGAVAGELKSGSGLNEEQIGVQGQYKQKMEVKESNLTISLDGPKTVHVGKTGSFSLVGTTSYENSLGGSWSPCVTNVGLIGEVDWTSDSSNATVDANGTVNGTKPGNATITATYNGNAYSSTVTVEDHKWVEDSTTPPTCEAAGSTVYKCSACNETYSEVIEKLEHAWGDPTYTWTDDHSSVTAKRVCEHNTCDSCTERETVSATSTVVEDATCISKGKTKYTSGQFENPAFVVQTITLDDIPMTEHAWGEGEVTTPSTCSVAGVITYHCTTPGCDAQKKEAAPLDENAHKLDEHEAVEPTCDTPGSIQFWQCELCGSYFKDSSAENKITKAETVVAATGHEWGEPTYQWAPDRSSVTATRVCTHNTGDSCTETETANANSTVVEPATCISKGKTKYTSEQFKNSAFAVQTITLENIQMTDHVWDEGVLTTPSTCSEPGVITYHCTTQGCTAEKTGEAPLDLDAHDWGEWQEDEPSTCYEQGTLKRVCKSNPEHVEYKDAELADHLMVEHPAAEPTCDEVGNIQYWQCEYCGKCFEDETGSIQISEYDVMIPPNGHDFDFDTAVTTKEATCTEPGTIEVKCAVCGFVTTIEQDPLGHAWIECEESAGLLRNGKIFDYCLMCGKTQNVKTLAGYATYYVKSLKVTKAKKAFTVKWAKQSAANQKKFNGYQIRYSLKSNMAGAKYVKAAKSSKSKKISKLLKKKKYYVQVRTYTVKNGKTFYSKWSAKKAVKTK